MTDDEVKAIIDLNCKKFYPSLCADGSYLNGEQKELVRELIQYAYEGIDVYSDHTGSHYCRNIDGILKELGLND